MNGRDSGGSLFLDGVQGAADVRESSVTPDVMLQSSSRRRSAHPDASTTPFSPTASSLPLRSHRSNSYSLSKSPHKPTLLTTMKAKERRAGRVPEERISLLRRYGNQVERYSQRAQLAAERQFRKHGRRIAQHPVQTLLLACLIITSLFYPAVGIYLWSSKGGPGVTRGDAQSVWRSLSTPLLDSFASSGRKHHNSLRDLRMIWDDAPDLRAIDIRDIDGFFGGAGSSWTHLQTENETSDAGKECHSIRLEHVFITTDDVLVGLGPRYGALHSPILRSALSLQRSIESVIGSDDSRLSNVPRCIRDLHGNCLTLSPLSFWSTDKDRISLDDVPTDTILSTDLHVSEQGIPLTLSTTLAGRSHLFKQLPRAEHLALTFFLEDAEGCRQGVQEASGSKSINPSHGAWSAMLRNITGRQVSLLGSDWQMPKELVLQFIPRHPEESFPTQKVFLTAAYVSMIVWLTRSLFSVRNVHWPLGLAFTAFVELIISMTLAISICALVGVRLTLIPWEILPFVIVVIGSENMFALTKAIISTPISLNVSSRLAAGFEKVGVPIAVTVASDIFLMAVIAFSVDVRAVREFCIFAIFALIVDFFMQISFYATVLSIDMQRLELADLLSQDSRDSPLRASLARGEEDSNQSETASDAGSKDAMKANSSQEGKSSLILMSCRAVWRARTMRTASLSLLLAFMAGIYLYHGTGYTSSLSFPLALQEKERAAWKPIPSVVESSTRPLNEESLSKTGEHDHAFDPFSHLRDEGATSRNSHMPWWHSSPSARLWQILNPSDAATLQVKVEPWTVVSLPSATQQHVGKRNFASWAIFRPRVRAIIWFSKLVVLPIAGTTALLWILLLYLLKDTELLEAQQDKHRTLDEEDDLLDQQEADRAPQMDVSLSLCGDPHESDVVLVAQQGPYVVSMSADSTLQATRMSKKNGSTRKILLSDVLPSCRTASALILDPSADMLVVSHSDGALAVFTLTDLTLIRTLNNSTSNRILHTSIVRSTFDLRPYVVTFHVDGSVRACTQESADWIVLVEGSSTSTIVSAFEVANEGTPSRAHILTTSTDGAFSLYKLGGESNSLIRQIFSHHLVRGFIKSAAIVSRRSTSRAELLLVGTALGKLALFDMQTYELVDQLEMSGSGPLLALRTTSIPPQMQNGAWEEDSTLVIARHPSKVSLIRLGEAKGMRDRFAHDVPQNVNGLLDVHPLTISMTARSPSSTTSNGMSRSARRLSQSKPAPSMITPPQSPNGTLVNGMGVSSQQQSSTGKTALSRLSLLASVLTKRGGSEIFISADGTSLLGVRRRDDGGFSRKSTQESNMSSNRWEIVILDLLNPPPALSAALEQGQGLGSSNEKEFERFLLRAPLPLEEGDVGSFSSSFRGMAEYGRSKSLPNCLSFTHISHVQSFYKHDEGHKKNKIAVLVSYGNLVTLIHPQVQNRQHASRRH